MRWAAIVTAIVAVYGAILATYTQLAMRREKKRRIAVELSFGFPEIPGIGLGPQVLFLSASNPGDRSVSLNGSGLLLPDERTLVFPDPEGDVTFPCDLEEGKSCRVWIPTDTLARELRKAGLSGGVKLVGFYNDALGDRHKSKPIKFQIDDKVRSREPDL